MSNRVAKTLDSILYLVQKKKLNGNYTFYVVDFKIIGNKWYVSYGVQDTMTGISDMSAYEEFDITQNIPYIKETFCRYSFYVRHVPGELRFIKPIAN